jgi:hypothetical protein
MVDDLPNGASESRRMLEQGVRKGVAGENVDEGAAGCRVVFTGPYEWVELLQVREQLYDRTSRQILTG